MESRGKYSRKFAVSNRILFEEKINKSNVIIYSLSPSDYVIENSKKEISKLIPKENSDKIKIIDNTINETSVVILIMIDNFGILLGSDLENNKHSEKGWQHIIEESVLKDKKIYFFKIPHHGSITGHSEKLWKNHIEKDSYSIMTPFIKGKNKIPANEQIELLLKQNEEIYITSSPFLRKKVKRENPVEKMIDQVAKNINIINDYLGHIRIRFKIEELNSKKEIKLFYNAIKLKSLVETK